MPKVKVFDVGDRVKFLENPDMNLHEQHSEIYPEYGTVGTIVYAGLNSSIVKWPRFTTLEPGEWTCENDYLEKVSGG